MAQVEVNGFAEEVAALPDLFLRFVLVCSTNWLCNQRQELGIIRAPLL